MHGSMRGGWQGPLAEPVAYSPPEWSTNFRSANGEPAPNPSSSKASTATSFARPPMVGAEAVASEAKNVRDGRAGLEPVIVNGAPGLVVRFPTRIFLVAFTVAKGRIVEIDLIADADKLRGL